MPTLQLVYSTTAVAAIITDRTAYEMTVPGYYPTVTSAALYCLLPSLCFAFPLQANLLQDANLPLASCLDTPLARFDALIPNTLADWSGLLPL